MSIKDETIKRYKEIADKVESRKDDLYRLENCVKSEEAVLRTCNINVAHCKEDVLKLSDEAEFFFNLLREFGYSEDEIKWKL